ncbi:glycosyltransferase family 4 protein [Methanotrichaceae archaeon M04Ac]|uniref:Glycosyltransferase family 4 protein n=1 Tax=Candidatus Methanocrinis alkalitolerans TaxID=3033395 RepID=A0ABT5XHY6_9EURY|nr:glycosyltransferase family 4 protein [Candidatus Methanocrinis alkalitolerans]MDF0594334.1 glycosyltransferase family 4 protein [Candidatus Methanocrinis alkalitolerans]
MRVAYFTPISPQKTGISDYSEKEVLPYLNKYIDLDIFIDENVTPQNTYIFNNFNIYLYKNFLKTKAEYKTIIYNMGNNSYHKFIYDSLIVNPGITILHDIYLHGFLGHFTLLKGDGERYIEEFEYCYGELGRETASKAIKADIWTKIHGLEYRYPLIKRVIDNSLGVVCHSNYGVNKVLDECDSAIVVKINQPFNISNNFQYNEYAFIQKIKKKFKLEGRWPIMASFGFIFPHKRFDVILRSFKIFLTQYPNAVFLLVGRDSMGVSRLISNLELQDSVIATGYAAHKDVLDYLAISDFCINLRYPTAGETSRSVLQLMAAEKPVIVSNVGWFSEIPDKCCLKVDVDSYEEDVLLEYMRLLASDERLRKQIGKNAREYVQEEHDPQKIAREFYIFIKNVLDGREYILNKVSKELADMGVKEEDTEIISHLSKRISNII